MIIFLQAHKVLQTALLTMAAVFIFTNAVSLYRSPETMETLEIESIIHHLYYAYEEINDEEDA